MEIEVKKLLGLDTDILNATVEAVRCDNFIAYNNFFSGLIPIFFKKTYLTKDGKELDLSIFYKELSMQELVSSFNIVLAKRKEQLKWLFDTVNVNIDENFDDYTRAIYELAVTNPQAVLAINALSDMNLIEVLKMKMRINEINKTINKG